MFREIVGDRRGAISILSAVVIVAIIGFAALALEYGNGLLQQVEDQRIADLAAYSAALVYNSTGSSSSANSAAQKMASLNGLSSSAASTSVGNSPTGDGNQAVQVTVSTSAPLLLARVLTTNTSIPVNATAYAEISNKAPGCIIALSGSGTGVTVTSASSITADNCTVASNASVAVSSASTITTKTVDYDTTYPSVTSASSINPPTGTASVTYTKTSTADPLAGNSEVTGATARLSTVSSIASPTVPSGGSSLSFTLTSMTGTLPSGCSTSSSASPWTVNCTGSGTTFSFGALSVTGATTVTFNTSSTSTYIFSGGITIAGSTTVSFGAGTFEIGASASSCNGVATGYSICNTSSNTLTFGGPSTFVLAGGMYNGSSAKLSMGGASSSNSYNIGAAADGTSINSSSATTVTLGGATGTGDIFQTAGSIITSSASSLTIPAATEHDIHGSISLAAASTTTLGAGIYTVTGYVSVGSAGASTLSASGVTLVIGGASTPSSGSCSGAAYCVANASNVTLTAPSSGATENLAVVGPTSSAVAAGAVISSAGGSSISGAFYFPYGAVSVSSASGLGGGSGQCLELVGSEITATSASGVGSTCSGLGSSSTGMTIGLVR
jgi:Putative Flp pilus-assembly TadE/G-like